MAVREREFKRTEEQNKEISR